MVTMQLVKKQYETRSQRRDGQGMKLKVSRGGDGVGKQAAKRRRCGRRTDGINGTR